MPIVKIVCDNTVFRICKNKLDKLINIDKLTSTDVCKKFDFNCYLLDVDPSAVQFVVDEARGYQGDLSNPKTVIGLQQLGYNRVPTLAGGSYESTTQVNEIFKKLDISKSGNLIKDLDDPAVERAIEEYNLKLENDSTTDRPFNSKLSEELKSLQKGGLKKSAEKKSNLVKATVFDTEEFTASENANSATSEFITEYRTIN